MSVAQFHAFARSLEGVQEPWIPDPLLRSGRRRVRRLRHLVASLLEARDQVDPEAAAALADELDGVVAELRGGFGLA